MITTAAGLDRLPDRATIITNAATVYQARDTDTGERAWYTPGSAAPITSQEIAAGPMPAWPLAREGAKK